MDADISPLRKALGILIMQLREERHLTQEALAGEADIDRSYLGMIERCEVNPTIEKLDKIAKPLGETVGTLIIQAEEMIDGSTRKRAPKVVSEYIDEEVLLPQGLDHDQLEIALNRAMALLDQIGLNPDTGDIQRNIYSGVVSNIVTKAIAEASQLVQNKDTDHPDLYNPHLASDHPDWGLEMKATSRVGKGGESHNPGQGWFMVVIYNIIETQTHIVQVEVAKLKFSDWIVNERQEHSKRTRTAVTTKDATRLLRKNSVYAHEDYMTAEVRKAIQQRRQTRLF